MTTITAWLLTLALHSFVLLTVAFVLDALWRGMRDAWRELAWKVALFGALLTATAQIAPHPSPLSSRWTIAQEAPSAPATLAATPQRLPLPAESRTVRPPPTIEHATTSLAPIPSDPPVSVPWWRYALLLWALGAAFACLRTGARLARCLRDLRHVSALDRAELRAELAALAASAGTRVPRLQQSHNIASPLALTGARIVLPEWALDSLDRGQLRAMLAHELGHVARRDPAFKLAIAFWCALFWWLPLARLAQRRLDELAELACDAFAAQQTGDRRGLAECLAACGEHHVHGPALELAPGMAARTSSLLGRIERLLDGVVMESPAQRALGRAIAWFVLGVGALVVPGIAVDAAVAQSAPAAAPVLAPAIAAAAEAAPVVQGSKSPHTNLSYTDDSGHHRITISDSDGTHKFRADVDGKIEFTDDESDVRLLDPNGLATFEETRDGVKRRIEIEASGDQLKRRFFVDGKEQPYDDAARQWMKQVVLDLARAGVGAEARVRRLYRQGGADRVLDEVAQIGSDYVRGVYLGTLLDLGKLTPAQLDRAIAFAGAIGSDYERHQALSKVFSTQALDPARQLAFLRQALAFTSDYELAELLIGVLPHLANTPELRQAWLDAGLKLKSDYERRRTLEAMVARGGLDDAQLASVVQASTSMKSDYERRTLLAAVAHHAHDLDAFAPAYVQAVQGLSSDYEKREALIALIRSGRLGARGATAVLDGAARIASSYECREVLVALARDMPQDATLESRYRDVAGKLSEYDRGEAEQGLRR